MSVERHCKLVKSDLTKLVHDFNADQRFVVNVRGGHFDFLLTGRRVFEFTKHFSAIEYLRIPKLGKFEFGCQSWTVDWTLMINTYSDIIARRSYMSSIINDIKIKAEIPSHDVFDRFQFLGYANSKSIASNRSTAMARRFPALKIL